ncbi:nitronate monooxygenase family protein [Ideonella sp. A 288]|uniref:NAD(P)H-dependent flavin oxidoreductase n=1 Tax=Ideonella sp. A 288 TaxID=1962181 RepID=UPI000B4C0D8F|nr:nitronate monooxygenase [Ideonella sp. A 288]
MNALAQRLGIEFPLIQAGMGGIAGVELAVAVADAGAGGVLGLYRSAPTVITELIARARRLTTRPLGVNLIPELVGERALAGQIAAVLEASDPSLFFTFYGLPDAHAADTVKDAGRALMVMVGDIEAMTAAEALGADAVILQGIEAGGHLLGSQRLDSLVDEALALGGALPLVASGGIASGARFRALHERGISGCLCGTLFVATVQSMAHPLYKDKLVAAGPQDTVVTRVFDIGWPDRRHRVLRNKLTALGGKVLPNRFIACSTVNGTRHPLPRYSAMVPGRLTEGAIDEMAMYCGESVSGVDAVVDAGALVERFVEEFQGHRAAAQAEGVGT